ncbi:MAG: hypothetical protein N3F08_04210, partial [Crenarchaeota archaeon]|nr:hypothetical protein [Thermoproteota archaeon]
MEGRAYLKVKTVSTISVLFMVILFQLNSLKLEYASGWDSTVVHLDWNARLMITLITEDGEPLEEAWVYVVDAYTRGNVTAAITDNYGL